MNESSLRCLVAAFILSLLLKPVIAFPTEKYELLTTLDDVARVVHGATRTYKGSHILCAASNVRKNARAVKSGSGAEELESCKISLKPNLRALISPAASGDLEHITTNHEEFEKLSSLLRRLRAILETEQILPLQKMAVQLVVWELYSGLLEHKKSATPAAAAVASTLASESKLVLSKVLMTDGDIKALPNTLLNFAQLAHWPESKSYLQRLLDPSGSFTEVLNPSILHTMVSRGRLITRVFLEFEKSNAVKWESVLRKYDDAVFAFDAIDGTAGDLNNKQRKLEQKSGSVVQVTDLPQSVRNLHAVLLAFVAVLDTHWKPQPTSIVGLWADYRVDGIAPPLEQTLNGKNEFIFFTSVELLRPRRESQADLEYLLKNEEEVEPTGFMPRNATMDGAIATTMRDNCIQCHVNRIASLNPREITIFRLSRPFQTRVPSVVQTYWDESGDLR